MADLLFALLVAFWPAVDLPEAIIRHPEYLTARTRYLQRHELDDFAGTWWIDSPYQPHVVRGVQAVASAYPRCWEVRRFGWCAESCRAEAAWADEQIAALQTYRVVNPHAARECDAWEWYLTTYYATAYRELGYAKCVSDPYHTRSSLETLRGIIGDEAFRAGVMPSRPRVWR